MSERWKVAVTLEDIAKGKIHDCEHCPVAIAMARALGVDEVTVGYSTLVITYPQGDTYRISKNALLFILDFDAQGKGVPFEFEMELVRPGWMCRTS